MSDSLAFDENTSTISVPEKAGVVYSIDGVPVEGSVQIDAPVVVTATVQPGFVLAEGAKTSFEFSPKEKPPVRENRGEQR